VPHYVSSSKLKPMLTLILNITKLNKPRLSLHCRARPVSGHTVRGISERKPDVERLPYVYGDHFMEDH